MTLQTLAWLSMAAYALHIMEEYSFDWRNWARAVIKLPVEWSDFYVTNAIVIALGHCSGAIGAGTAVRTADVRLSHADQRRVLPYPARVRERGDGSRRASSRAILFSPGRNSRMVEGRARRPAELDHGGDSAVVAERGDGLPDRHAEPQGEALFSADLNACTPCAART